VISGSSESPTLLQVSSSTPVEDELVMYLEVKQQILLSYCVNIIFYLMLKVRFLSSLLPSLSPSLTLAGRRSQCPVTPCHETASEIKVRSPAFSFSDRLSLRYIMERMRHLDGKMKHQIDRLLSSADQSTGGPATSARPNINALMDAADEGDDDEESDEDDKHTKSSRSGVYRAPKTHAVMYKV
jgi:U3 small nucleolar RNA-associated protein 3